MAVGSSNRVVIEIDPNKKKQIYAALKQRGFTMREWFLMQAERELLSKPKEASDE